MGCLTSGRLINSGLAYLAYDKHRFICFSSPRFPRRPSVFISDEVKLAGLSCQVGTVQSWQRCILAWHLANRLNAAVEAPTTAIAVATATGSPSGFMFSSSFVVLQWLRLCGPTHNLCLCVV